ncbi:MAG TPA: serine/threonine-protein kinase [Kofleriaceae bacterium]|nr:serine/threonine-protein kinase [Kofleriaceae bacterium]
MDGSGERLTARPDTESDAPLRGRQLGDFVLRELIGEGGSSTVYRCDQPNLGREAVVKVLHQRMRDSEVMLQRFVREARLASRLDHPYAAHVYAFGVEPEDGLAWIAMELVHGTSLERWLVERGPLPLDVLVPFFEQVAEIVQNAHDHGIVHRDLKPSNVMIIEYAGRIIPKLLDFGIAKLIDEAHGAWPAATPQEISFTDMNDSGNINLTQANTTLGSPPYMSPEQWTDPLSVGPRSDLYSLGVMVYEALTGRQPFTGATIPAIGEQHCSAEVPSVGDGFSPALDRVFRRALAKMPADRPVSALAFARELRNAAFPRSSTAHTATEPLPTLAPRRRWPWTVGAAAVLCVAVGLFVVVGAGREPASTATPAALAGPVALAPSPVLAPAAAPAVPAPVAVPPARATVRFEVTSTPPGAEVFRHPSGIKLGTTPWNGDLPSDDGAQVLLIKLKDYGDERVEIDLRTGGSRHVQLRRLKRRPAPGHPSPMPATAPTRRPGEPVDPFSGGT